MTLENLHVHSKIHLQMVKIFPMPFQFWGVVCKCNESRFERLLLWIYGLHPLRRTGDLTVESVDSQVIAVDGRKSCSILCGTDLYLELMTY